MLTDYNLKAHNTFGIEARCRRFVELNTVDECVSFFRSSYSRTEPMLIIGSGSNLLLTGDFPGTVVHSAIHGMQVSISGDDVYVTAGSGMEWDTLAERCCCNGWHGTENLSLIPGEVGAAAVQNIGAYGTEACQLIDKVEVVDVSDGTTRVIPADDCDYGYRDSRFKHDWKGRYLITRVTLRLSLRYEPKLDYGNIRAELDRQGISRPTAQQLRDVIIAIRRNKLPDPKVTGNAGSFFMNPVVARQKFEELLAQDAQMPHYYVDGEHEKIPAGWLIEQCGWKGKALGRAGVHDRQALVLVNRGGATGTDIVSLCKAIQHDVLQRYGIALQPEVNII